MKNNLRVFIYLFFIGQLSYSQHFSERLNSLDIIHYKNEVELSDNSNLIKGSSTIDIIVKQALDSINLDLVSKGSAGKGMQVLSVLKNGIPIGFSHRKHQLKFANNTPLNNLTKYTIKYEGIPADGLIIEKNRYQDRTFFADNWPNRAHNWFPCVDHPSDKATVEFLVTAPNHYQVIATGVLLEESNINDQTVLYHYKSDIQLPSKVMVIGVARFAVQQLAPLNGIPFSSWVYPQNKVAGFYDYALAKNITAFFIDRIGDFPFEKLANVQSKTRFGGMENAGNIFYHEQSVDGKRGSEALLAHEIVHQWFGDSATEKHWSHLWLSEGFATYLTDLYFLETQGEATFHKRLKNERNKVIRFYKNQQTPVVDTQTKNYLRLLNANSYQKGAWFLHMLRNKIGDKLFWKGIRAYYKEYQFSNANTDDFRKVIEAVSGKNLNTFFNDWLFTAGHPVLRLDWQHNNKSMNLTIIQTQETPISFPLEVSINYTDGSMEFKTINVVKKTQTIALKVKKKVKSVDWDPEVKLLFEVSE